MNFSHFESSVLNDGVRFSRKVLHPGPELCRHCLDVGPQHLREMPSSAVGFSFLNSMASGGGGSSGSSLLDVSAAGRTGTWRRLITGRAGRVAAVVSTGQRPLEGGQQQLAPLPREQSRLPRAWLLLHCADKVHRSRGRVPDCNQPSATNPSFASWLGLPTAMARRRASHDPCRTNPSSCLDHYI